MLSIAGGLHCVQNPPFIRLCTVPTCDSQMLFSILRSTEPYLDVYFSEAGNIDAELQEAGFTTVSQSVSQSVSRSEDPYAVGRVLRRHSLLCYQPSRCGRSRHKDRLFSNKGVFVVCRTWGGGGMGGAETRGPRIIHLRPLRLAWNTYCAR